MSARPAVDPLIAGLRCRCPACGQGPLYSGFLKVVDRCAVCGLDLSRLNTGDGPAVFIMQIAGFITGFSALYVELTYQPPIWLHLVIWLPLAAGIAFALMRPMKGLMVGLQIKHKAGEARRG